MENYQQINERKSFKLIAISMPFLLFVILEFLLRLFHVGYSTRLFLEDSHNDTLVHNNIHISRLFFNSWEAAPNAYVQYFSRTKPDNTFRIFVLGESSALGFPYNHRGSFPRMLQYMLDKYSKGKKIEVINLAITAVNSYAILTFSGEIVKMDPDAILIYTGHNEYYGALGAGSMHRLGLNRNLIKLNIQLKKLRLVQLGFRISEKIRNQFKVNQNNKTGLMIKMAGDQQIPFNSKLFKKGLQQFEYNMNEVLREFGKHQIPVYFSDLVCNVRSQKPFISKLSLNEDTTQILSLYRKGCEAYSQHNSDIALEIFLTAEKIDSTHAMNNFLIAEILYDQGNFKDALKYFSNAKELDVLRFRAPQDINRLIRKLSMQNPGVYFVPAQQKFMQKSPHKILGNELFTDHLHPNLEGNFLLASAFYESLQQYSDIGETVTDSEMNNLRMEMPVTFVDSLHGTWLINYMKQKWPFFDTLPFSIEGKTYPEKLTFQLFNKHISWDIAMDSLYRYYLQIGQIDQAIRVAKAYDLENPQESYTTAEIGRLYQLKGKYAEGFFYYKKAFEKSGNIDFARKMVIVLLKMDQPEKSVKYLKIIRKQIPGDAASVNLQRMCENVIRAKQILLSSPGDVVSIKILARYYLYIENLKKAKAYIDKLMITYPNDPLNSEYHRKIAE